MAGSKKKHNRQEAIPRNFSSLESFWEFWDGHSTADYEDLMEEVGLKAVLHSSKAYCSVARELIQPLRNQAHRQGISTETLINLWLKEKVAKRVSV